MDSTSIGAGAGAGGVVGAVLTWLGIRDKFQEQEKRITDLEIKMDKNVDDKLVWRTTCAATHKAVDESLERIENKLDRLIERK